MQNEEKLSNNWKKFIRALQDLETLYMPKCASVEDSFIYAFDLNKG